MHVLAPFLLVYLCLFCGLLSGKEMTVVGITFYQIFVCALFNDFSVTQNINPLP